MKLILQFIFAVSLILSCAKANEVDSHHDMGRCTGSASCTACSNCTRCGHCSSGGTCGVCSGSSSGRSFYSSSSRSAKKKKSSNSYSTSSSSYRALGSYSYPKPKSETTPKSYSTTIYSETLSIRKDNVNIRELPSLNSKIIAVLDKYSTLKNLGKTGNWYKVEISATGEIGYVYESLVD